MMNRNRDRRPVIMRWAMQSAIQRVKWMVAAWSEMSKNRSENLSAAEAFALRFAAKIGRCPPWAGRFGGYSDRF